MEAKLLRFTFLLALPLTLVGCNNKIAEFTSKIEAIKTSSGVDIVVKDSVKDFRRAGFKYGDLIDFSFANREDPNNPYKYTAPFVTNYTTAGMFNVSICDYEKANNELTISLGASDAYNKIDSNYIGETISFKMNKSGGWNSTYELVPLSQKRTYKFIGRDNYVYCNARDIKIAGENLRNKEIGSGFINRFSSSFDFVENAKRYSYSDGVLGDIMGSSVVTGEDRFVLLVNLNYNDFRYYNRAGIDINFKSLSKDLRPNSNFTKIIAKSIKDPQECAILSLNIADNYFSDVNRTKIANLFYNDTDPGQRGIINILSLKVKEVAEKNTSNYSLVLDDCEGIERTGFISMLLAALAGASYKDLVADYMISYKNYYNILPYGETLDQYNCIKSLTIDRLIYGLCTSTKENDETFKNTDWSKVDVATSYIKNNKIDEKDNFINEAKTYIKWLYKDKQYNVDTEIIKPLKDIIRGYSNAS